MTGEPSLVAGAAALLESTLRYNANALPRLYLTGAFFMALAYCGSNLVDIAQLFRVGVQWLTRAAINPTQSLQSRDILTMSPAEQMIGICDR